MPGTERVAAGPWWWLGFTLAAAASRLPARRGEIARDDPAQERLATGTSLCAGARKGA
ncbi:MAG TPA: hypothetical protein VHZ03_28385 [Trebonia sp.]|nr:hypothetical protein [Trebonia sp.]